jgi:hypothetical protein
MVTPFSKPVVCPVLIDRVNDLATLHALIDQAKSGRGQVVLLCGEAGIGKSRLVAETKPMLPRRIFFCSRETASRLISLIRTLLCLISCAPPPPTSSLQQGPPTWPPLLVNCTSCCQISCPYRLSWLQHPHLILNSRNAASLRRWPNSS